ncbi:uncharacterized protein LOC135359048 [Latimeria chalumnae]|uniref:uncharacterized protein LOC135359048 n=1 Tax=Latimeria chalumnae TaxID=7897 RepID=UPI00313DBBD6
MQDFGFSQSVCSATHESGHMLDLVFSKGISVSNCTVNPKAWSDHYLVHFDFGVAPPPHKTLRSYSFRPGHLLVPDVFQEMVSSSESLFSKCKGVDSLVDMYNSVLSTNIDLLAPLRTWLECPSRRPPWFNSDLKQMKASGQRLERRWRVSGLVEDRSRFRLWLRSYQKSIRNAKSIFFVSLIDLEKYRPTALFRVVNQLLNPSCLHPSDTFGSQSCDSFLSYFSNKVDLIRSDIVSYHFITEDENFSRDTSNRVILWDSFSSVSDALIEQALRGLKATTCIFDPCPSWLIKECLRDWVPLFTGVVNASLEEGHLPAALKRASVSPLLKQASLDPDDLGNYRPISNLPFLGKVIEKVVAGFLREHLNQFNFYDRFQSGFRPGHSTESALVRVVSDLLTPLDKGLVAFLVQLDLSSAFDTIDHGILLHRLEHLLGISGSVLSWFRSFLEGRSQVVCLGSSLSAPAEISCGVPQGSILSPMLFAIYLLPLGAIAERFRVGFHCYADDVQLYLAFPANSLGEASMLEKCLSEIRSWMAGNWLRLNPKKTEVLLVGKDHVCESLFGTLSPPSLNDGVLRMVKVTKSLGVFLDASLTLERQISSVVSSGFFHLKNIQRLYPVLPYDSLSTLMHAFVSSRLDYCNALYAGLPLKAIHRLQLVQNAAARVVNNVSRFDHITPILQELHWLPIRWRITFKVLVLVFKTLNGLGPAYLRDFLTPYVPARPLHSISGNSLVVPRFRSKLGERSFAFQAAVAWNAISVDLKSSLSLSIFKSRLKTFLFESAFNNM